MPPGKPLQPVLRMKVDELFLRWLSDPGTQDALRDGLRRLQEAGDVGDVITRGGDAIGSDVTHGDITGRRIVSRSDITSESDVTFRNDVTRADVISGDPGPHLAPPLGIARPARAPGRTAEWIRVRTQEEPSPPPPPEAPPPAAPPPGPSIPAFFFPHGRPGAGPDVDYVIARVERVFAGFERQRVGLKDMGVVAKACGCPLYWKAPLFYAAGGARTGSLSVHKFLALWRKVLVTCHDDAARFVRLLSGPGGRGLAQEDFQPLLQDVVNTHPGLAFLKEAPEFHSRYISTVIQRIFYTVNRSWSGRITCSELRRSRFLQEVERLEAEPDVSRLPAFFSYAHFYVIYVRFWELDGDHDLVIDRDDLGRHGDRAISSRVIDRIFSGAVTRGGSEHAHRKLTYEDFVWFLISEEDKTTPTSIEYWFRVMDLDGDGALSMFELEFFYAEQAQRLEARGVEPPPFRDLACQMLDMVNPRVPGQISLPDLRRCGLAAIFFDAFINADKFLAREQRELGAGPARDADPAGTALSDWDRFVEEEYDFLVAEEGLPTPPDPDLYEFQLGEDDDDLEPL